LFEDFSESAHGAGRGYPEATVVVTTHQRQEMLRDLLGALSAQTCARDRFEVVVCDAASTDGTPAVVAQAAAAGRIDLRYVRLGTTRANRARNAGIRAAHGAVVAFLDDDELVPPDWLEHGLATLAEHPELDGVTGPYREYGEMRSRVCAGCRRTTLLGVFDAALPSGVRIDRTEFLRGGNAFVRREAFGRHGAFDEQIVGLGDETDWCRRASLGGARFAYVPALWVHHRRDGAAALPLLWRRFRTFASLVDVERRWGRWPYGSGFAPLHRFAWLAHAARHGCWGGVLHFADGFFNSRPGHRLAHVLFYRRLEA
jgi:GT2 family glycosyltransferase